jgi:hypothetical protein
MYFLHDCLQLIYTYIHMQTLVILVSITNDAGQSSGSIELLLQLAQIGCCCDHSYNLVCKLSCNYDHSSLPYGKAQWYRPLLLYCNGNGFPFQSCNWIENM